MIVCHRKDPLGQYYYIQLEKNVDDWSKVWSDIEFSYTVGRAKPRYPVPATEVINALATPYERCMPIVKRMVLELYNDPFPEIEV
jgi:hypothetical protein